VEESIKKLIQRYENKLKTIDESGIYDYESGYDDGLRDGIIGIIKDLKRLIIE
jgi:hypothetical protein